MRYRRTPIEVESPEQLGYDTIRNNLAESSFSDMSLAGYEIDADVTDLVLPYADHLGLERLRDLIADEGPSLRANDVLVTAGAASALFIVATSLIDARDHLLVCAPNYVTNLETPRAIGAELEPLKLRFEDGWALDLDLLAARLRPETRLVSVTYPHNPTGATVARAGLEELVSVVESHPTARLLVDETYRELAYGEVLPPAASLSPRVIAVSSMSKTYGLPGLRIGWLTCRDEELMETFLAAKEQIFISGAVIEEELTARVHERRASILEHVRTSVRANLDLVRDWIGADRHFEWVQPAAGVVGFPRLRDEAADVDRFYGELFDVHGTYVGPGHWFDEDRRYFRLGFGWPPPEELERGLAALTSAAARA
jgi:aspartate/methionine/tyrosine aminotransferase